jgi:hypothetical protein
MGESAPSRENPRNISQHVITVHNWRGCAHRNVSQQDQGIYECQINTDPKLNKRVYLQIEGTVGKIIFLKKI